MNKGNCVLKLVVEIILYYDARSKKYQKNLGLNPQNSKCQKRLPSTLVESGLSPLSTSVLCRCLQRAKIPDAM